MKPNNRKLLTLIIVPLIILGTSVGIYFVVIDYFDFATMKIETDKDWHKYIRTGLIHGNGNPENPYIIENFSIKTFKRYGIYIANSQKNFIIRNCVIIPDGYGIFLSNIKMNEGVSVIENNELKVRGYGENGIRILDSNGIIIQNNTISEYYGGITCKGSGITIRNNIIESCDYGISIEDNENLLVVNNTLFDCGFYYYSYFRDDKVGNEAFRFANNSVNGKELLILIDESNLSLNQDKYSQIFIQNGSNIHLENIAISNIHMGMMISDSSNISLSNCSFTNNEAGCYIIHVEALNINSSIYLNNRYGLHIFGVNGLNVTFSVFLECYYGILMYTDGMTISNMCYIHHNSFIDNDYHLDPNGFEDYLVLYDSITSEGNYWTSWEQLNDYFPYYYDLFPLTEPPV